jgi:predicted nucleic acid-binding protein
LQPVLVDSSLWVHQLRRSGDATRRERVNGLLRQGVAGWCPVVRLELWRGVTNDTERRVLERYASVLSDYAITDAVWERAFRLADLGRAAGLTDLLIFACARVHSVELAHDDGHFDQLATLRP